MVGAEIELEVGVLLTCRVEEGLGVGIVLLQVSASFLLGDRLECGLFEILLGNDYAGEELVLEGHPVDDAFGLLLVLALLIQVLGVIVVDAVGEGRELLLEAVSLLQLTGTLVPVEVHRLGAGGEEVLHPLGMDGEVGHIEVSREEIVEVDVLAFAHIETHGDGAVRCIQGLEVEVFGQDILILPAEGKVHAHLLVTIEKHDGVSVLSLIVGKGGFAHGSSLGRELEFDETVFQCHERFFALCSRKEGRSGVGHIGLSLLLLFGQSGRFESRLLLHDLLDRILIVLDSGHLFLTGTIVDAETNQHQTDKGESD